MDDRYELVDRNIPWLGNIPRHWLTSRIKYLHRQTGDSFIDGDWIESPQIVDDGIRYITTGNVGEGRFKFQGSGHITDTTFRELNCTEVFPGDLLISRLSPPVGRSCIVPDLGKRIVTSVDNVIIRLKDNLDKHFYNYLFNSKNSYENTSTLSRGTTLTRISRSMLGDIETIIPPLDEQRLISRYLDKKTQQIDTLIEKIEKKIELLKEQRTSRINHYVTKGLDPNVEMKDSGVEWIGKIPKHWEVTKLKYLVSYNDSVLTEDTNPNYQFHYIEISDVDYIDGIKLTDKTIFSESPSRARRIVQPNDVIISTVRTYLRAIGVVPNKSDIICSTGFCVLRDNSGKLDQQFLSYIVKANWFISRVISESFGVSYPAINASALVELEVLLPPLDEQREICSFIQSRLKVSEAQIAHEKRRVSLVSEYRQSLISSVVTGKVRVTEDMV